MTGDDIHGLHVNDIPNRIRKNKSVTENFRAQNTITHFSWPKIPVKTATDKVIKEFFIAKSCSTHRKLSNLVKCCVHIALSVYRRARRIWPQNVRYRIFTLKQIFMMFLLSSARTVPFLSFFHVLIWCKHFILFICVCICSQLHPLFSFHHRNSFFMQRWRKK